MLIHDLHLFRQAGGTTQSRPQPSWLSTACSAAAGDGDATDGTIGRPTLTPETWQVLVTRALLQQMPQQNMRHVMCTMRLHSGVLCVLTMAAHCMRSLQAVCQAVPSTVPKAIWDTFTVYVHTAIRQ